MQTQKRSVTATWSIALNRALLSALIFVSFCGIARSDSINTWYVSRHTINTNQNGQRTPTGLSTSVLGLQRGVSINYTDIYAGQCSAIVSISFVHPNGVIGTCLLSGPNALVEGNSGTLPSCNPNNPQSWTSGCTMPEVCPQAGESQYACGVHNVNDPPGTPDRKCSCTPSNNPSGLGSPCVSNGKGGGYYYCGNTSTCACTPQGSAAANASYCANTGEPLGSCIQYPNSNLLAPETLNSQYTTTIEQQMDSLAVNRDSVAPMSLVNAINGLSDETNGCLNNN